MCPDAPQWRGLAMLIAFLLATVNGWTVPSLPLRHQHSQRIGSAFFQLNTMKSSTWCPSSWKGFPILQQPDYNNSDDVNSVVEELQDRIPLVFPHEVLQLQEKLAAASRDRAFVLMGGDCAESFSEFSVPHVQDTIHTLLQISSIISKGCGQPVVTIARMAGQFAKPRSEPTEQRNGETLPTYRGDIINGEDFDSSSRVPDPKRMLRAYQQSLQTMNIMRATRSHPDSHPTQLHAKQVEFIKNLSPKLQSRMLPLISSPASSSEAEVFTAHECLLLPYEQALTREYNSNSNSSSTRRSSWVSGSGHLLWAGERTRQLDHAHLHFLSGLRNPVGVKVSHHMTPSDLLQMLSLLNPSNEEGKVVLIVRMGAEKLPKYLPALISAVQQEQRHVVWMCDPVHCNTVKTADGMKTRHFSTIAHELEVYLDVHRQLGSHPGGLHLELTGSAVTECMGGIHNPVTALSAETYRTRCDPRLNGEQAIGLSLLLAEQLYAHRK